MPYTSRGTSPDTSSPELSPPVRPRLLLHICCGPCATVAIERLRDDYALTGYYDNPNIHPGDEYLRRRDAAAETALRMGVPFVEGPHEPERFGEAVRGLEGEPENGARCVRCYRFRLDRAARHAAAEGFDAIATTLTTGPRKPAAIINPVGESAAAAAGVTFAAGDWKKQDGYRRSVEIAREFGLYRQRYCGCRFSIHPDD